MFGKVIYDEQNNTYQAIYKTEDERTAKWINDQYDDKGQKEETLTMVFAYKNQVVLSSKSKEVRD